MRNSVVRIAEALRQSLSTCLVSDMGLPVRWVRRCAGHHNLDLAARVIVVVPFGPQPYQFPVEVDADAAAHADDHRLAVHRLKALLVVSDDVLGDLPDTILGPDNCFQLSPLRLEPLLALDFLALGGLFKVLVDMWARDFIKRQFGKPALIEDSHGCAVLH